MHQVSVVSTWISPSPSSPSDVADRRVVADDQRGDARRIEVALGDARHVVGRHGADARHEFSKYVSGRP